MSKVQDKIKQQIKENAVLLYMKGNPMFPQCGFSSQVVNVLKSYDVPFEAINVLEDDDIRQGIKDFSDWPTIPQLYVNGEFIGGCDIVCEMHDDDELKALFDSIEKED